MLKVGFGEADITPALGLPLAGMLDPPRAQGVRWPLYGRVALFEAGGQRAALVSLDLVALVYPTVLELRQALAGPGGLAPEDIMISCQHTHRAPYTVPVMDEPMDFAYIDILRDRLVEAMRAAAGSLGPARLRVGHIQAPGWTWNRRPVYRGRSSSCECPHEQVGTQGPVSGPDFLRMEGPEDNELIALAAEDESGRVLGGMVNFACHATVMGSLPYYSADFSGALVEEMDARLGGTFMFVQGAAGNLWAHDERTAWPGSTGGEEHNRAMGEALADKAVEALTAGGYVAGEAVRVERRVLSIPQRQPTREQVNLARWYLEHRPADLDEDEFTRRLYGHDYTFYHNSPRVQEWFCRETVAMWEWQRHQAVRQPSDAVEVMAISVGDSLAFVGYPAEYFTEFGLETKARSPFAHTIVAELANGWVGYVPTQQAFAHGGYETRLAYSSRLVPEAGDIMCRAGIGLLHLLAAAAAPPVMP
ncbi:MAG: hypothetical protein HPY83_02625 [Anaerolineae bacterium]|nr:hypothetical protein [Anaerolineae bacterium]